MNFVKFFFFTLGLHSPSSSLKFQEIYSDDRRHKIPKLSSCPFFDMFQQNEKMYPKILFAPTCQATFHIDSENFLFCSTHHFSANCKKAINATFKEWNDIKLLPTCITKCCNSTLPKAIIIENDRTIAYSSIETSNGAFFQHRLKNVKFFALISFIFWFQFMSYEQLQDFAALEMCPLLHCSFFFHTNGVRILPAENVKI